jgi:hypothetical protein
VLVQMSRLFESTQKLLVRGADSSCEAESCRARRRLVVQGGDLSEKLFTSRRLVKEASNWSEVRHLASDGLDRDP